MCRFLAYYTITINGRMMYRNQFKNHFGYIRVIHMVSFLGTGSDGFSQL